VLDTADLDALASALPRMPDPLLRGSALVTLWESMLEGRVSLFPLFPPVDKFAEQNNPFDQKHPLQRLHLPFLLEVN
jgi:hypothetical protein